MTEEEISDSPLFDATLEILETENKAFREIVEVIFQHPEVCDVRPCRSCGMPIIHMEHLKIDEAKALEERARALLGQEKYSFEREENEKYPDSAMQNEEKDALFTDPSGELPDALVKAINDPFDYALGLRTGQVIHFNEARLLSGGKWIQLHSTNGPSYNGGDGGDIEMTDVEYGFPRGVDVRISDIMWVADAPNGS